VAKGVLAYTFAPDGAVVFSNGAGIWKQSGSGGRIQLAKDEGITTVVALEEVD